MVTRAGLDWGRALRSRRPIMLIGECMLELTESARDTLHRSCGGDAYNTAVYLVRLAGMHGAKVQFVSALGTDPVSDWLAARWVDEGLDIERVARVHGRLPGVYWVQTDRGGERRFLYWRSESAARGLMGELAPESWAQPLMKSAVVVLSGITLAILAPDARTRLLRAVTLLRDAGAVIVFDPNFRPVLWPDLKRARRCMAAAVAASDVVLMSTEDSRAVWPRASSDAVLASFEHCGVQEIVIRDGAGPCIARVGGTTVAVSPTRRVHPVDTTAAGDSFNAGYLAARLAGEAPEAAVRLGHALAAAAIRHPGAIAPRSATDRAVRQFQRSHGT